MDFIIGLLILKNLKKDSYNLIQVKVNKLTKIINYKLVKTIINAMRLAKFMIDMVMKHYCFLNFITSNKAILFTLKF